MDKGKIYRIISANGFKHESFDSIDDEGLIYVIEDGEKYSLDGFTKTKIETTKEPSIVELMKDYKSEIILDDIDFEKKSQKNTKTDEWKPVAGIHNGLITRTEEELKRIKAIKKPRGWHFRDIYEDSEGNIYHKGILQ